MLFVKDWAVFTQDMHWFSFVLKVANIWDMALEGIWDIYVKVYGIIMLRLTEKYIKIMRSFFLHFMKTYYGSLSRIPTKS